MPIKAPGYRPKHSRVSRYSTTGRNVVAVLSLTAMVDMFTVLAIFLLQNYNPETNAVLDIPPEMTLPRAQMSRNLKPSHVVTITKDEIRFDEATVARTANVKVTEKWLVRPLFNSLRRAIDIAKKEKEKGFQKKLQKAVSEAKGRDTDSEDYRKVTVQADKDVSFRVIKKVMYTATEAGAGELNFAVLKKPTNPNQ